VDEKALFQRLDKIIHPWKKRANSHPYFIKVLNLAAMIASILGAIAIIDVFRNWFGG
jgi:hypothetical protein